MLKEKIITFLLFTLFSSISPGAGAILTISYGLNYGWKKTNISILGQEIALGIIITLITICTNKLMSNTKLIIPTIKIFGSLWLIYLGYSQWNAPIINIYTKNKNNIKYNLSFLQKFLMGFITNITNPKAIIFMMTTLPKFINNTEPIIKQAIFMSIIMMTIDGIIMILYAFTANKLQYFFKNKKMIKIQNRILGSILILIALSLYL
ncbi:LysE family translocator [Candidatus Zinderia endosymbiont of Aphrophora alni]|uniref:LysE family translocator n=1 Tax=Candidatus Zinderia endosymbiont of Aphrophora alni TaxID=3077951 RepID=UPI0030D20F97